jgi:hypothetical protein
LATITSWPRPRARGQHLGLRIIHNAVVANIGGRSDGCAPTKTRHQ